MKYDYYHCDFLFEYWNIFSVHIYINIKCNRCITQAFSLLPTNLFIIYSLSHLSETSNRIQFTNNCIKKRKKKK